MQRKKNKKRSPSAEPPSFPGIIHWKKVLFLFCLSDIGTKNPVEMKEDKGTLQQRKIQKTPSSPGYILLNFFWIKILFQNYKARHQAFCHVTTKKICCWFYKLERSYYNYAMGKWWDTFNNCCIHIRISFICYNKFFLRDVWFIQPLAPGFPIQHLAQGPIKVFSSLKGIFWSS